MAGKPATATGTTLPREATITAAANTRRAPLLWLQGVACGGVATFATPIALLAAALLAPGWMALLIDRQPGRPVARSVLLWGAAFTVGPVWHLWVAGGTMATAAGMLTDILVLGPAWIAGACGWALAELLPVLVKLALDFSASRKRALLRRAREELEQEWDLS